MRTVAFLSTFVLKTLVGIFLDKSKTECFGHMRLETLVIVVDGCLTSDDWFPFCRVDLFSPDEKVKLIDVCRVTSLKVLNLPKRSSAL